jgi:1,4-dihydroxy-2-naphthoate octaprenyltransferase
MNQNSKRQPIPFDAQKLSLFAASIFLYFLGAGIARYLGDPFKVVEFWSGFLYIILLSGSGFFLQIHFDPKELNNSVKSEDNLRKNRQYLLAGLALMAAGGLLAYFIYTSPGVKPVTNLFMVFVFLVMLLYAVPPVNLKNRGYGELTLVLMAANVIPALAYSIQTGSLHGLLVLISLPLTFFFLAMVISTNLNGYLNAMLTGEKNLVIRLGWKLAMDLHDWLIVGGYIFLGIAYIRGLPWNLIWPTFIALPVFLFTIYEIHRIKNGVKPRWALLTFSGYTGTGLVLYSLLFTLWFR